MCFVAPSHKNDQFREGHISKITTSGRVSITKKIFGLWPTLRRIVSAMISTCFHKSLGISSSSICNNFWKFSVPLAKDVNLYCLHSHKSSGASN